MLDHRKRIMYALSLYDWVLKAESGKKALICADGKIIELCIDVKPSAMGREAEYIIVDELEDLNSHGANGRG